MRRHRAALGGAFTLLLCACDGTVAGWVPDASSDTPGGSVLGAGSTAGSSGALGVGLGGSTANPGGVAGASASASVGGMAGAAVAGSGNVSAGGSAGSEPPVAGEQPVVELFQDCSYAGWQASLAVGEYQSADLEALGGVSHDASSLHVTPGFEAVLYAEDAFGDDSVVIDADTECLVAQNFNDLAASIVVRAATGGSSGTSGSGGSAGTSGSGGGGDNGGGGGTNTGGTGGSAEPDRYQRCVDRINEYRATEGLPALARRVDNEACADGQAKSDSETGTAHGAFNQCDDWAQNECPGWGSVDDVIDGCLQAMWDEGPGGGHYENMISDRTYVWCGFYITPGGKVWSVQDFK